MILHLTCLKFKPNVRNIFDVFLKGRKYTDEDAKNWINISNKGWQENAIFTYLIRNDEGRVAGAIDIKSNNLDRAEIGYWADDNQPGFITNANVVLGKIAKKAGYKKLFGLVKPENDKSKKVLKRAGYNYICNESDDNNEECERYELDVHHDG